MSLSSSDISIKSSSIFCVLGTTVLVFFFLCLFFRLFDVDEAFGVGVGWEWGVSGVSLPGVLKFAAGLVWNGEFGGNWVVLRIECGE